MFILLYQIKKESPHKKKGEAWDIKVKNYNLEATFF